MKFFHRGALSPPGTALVGTPAGLHGPGLLRRLGLAWLLLAVGCAGGGYRAGTAEPSPGYRDGVWRGSGRGRGGEVRVEVRIASGLIQEIGIVSHREDPFTGGEAMAELLELVLDYQTTDLDAVSGATESSAAFLTAVEEALRRAALSP